MSYLEELLPEFRKEAKIRIKKWEKESFIYYDGDVIRDECDCPIFSEVADWTDTLLSDKFELYQEPEPDWDYIIKNKCLCWFWDIVEEAKIVGILCKINYDSEHKFVRNFDGAKIAYRNCRPVRRDEVTFYEDRKE